MSSRCATHRSEADDVDRDGFSKGQEEYFEEEGCQSGHLQTFTSSAMTRQKK